MLQKTEARNPFSFFRTVTVGPGLAPDLRFSLENAPAGCPDDAGFTAGGDLHPALRVLVCFNVLAAAVKGRGGKFPRFGRLAEKKAPVSMPFRAGAYALSGRFFEASAADPLPGRGATMCGRRALSRPLCTVLRPGVERRSSFRASCPCRTLSDPRFRLSFSKRFPRPLSPGSRPAVAASSARPMPVRKAEKWLAITGKKEYEDFPD